MLRPTAISVTPLENFKLLILFDNKEQKIFDAKPLLVLKPYSALKDINTFKRVRTNGITIEWDNEIDICPDELYYSCKSI